MRKLNKLFIDMHIMRFKYKTNYTYTEYIETYFITTLLQSDDILNTQIDYEMCF